ncbi:deoxynucleoside kinase [Aliarcobacter butzleri]|uniref:deoxynucleoside kinase n=1 Tax=Aliarcobacter butzleri TaxID=28197 RepID=UPI0021B3456E|nr:deoxynucleoside kinase [Aliarcobacter butzleri]MCT7594872.1 deoxynucleoside kinase [Aliarcobacter butzleri]MCT7599327.1 deoxynucleoside kinase [Aliarcobacter butzleri]
MKNNRIEICGGIASGKTTLTTLLEKCNIGVGIYENFAINPFWESFYKNPKKYAFETEISFTLQHYHDIKKQITNNLLICDYSLLLDYAYADIGLTGNKYQIYKNILDEIYKDIFSPKLIIYLECSTKEELNRIGQRGREVEESISIDFLESLNKSLLNRLKNEKTKILTINSEEYNFHTNQNDKEFLISHIKNNLL